MAENRQSTAQIDEEREWEEDLDRFERGNVGTRPVSQEGQETMGGSGAATLSPFVEFGGETSEVGDALPRAASAVTSAVGDLFSWSGERRAQAEQNLRGGRGGSEEYRQPEDQGEAQQQSGGSDVSEERMDELLGGGEEGVNLYGDFETEMQARPGRQVTGQAGDLRLIEDAEGDENALITDLKPGSREGAAEGPMKFGGETGFTASGDEGATDAQMLEAMGGPMSQEDIDSFNQMIRNQKISNRMEAGDYEGMGAAEFSEAVQSEGMPESSAPVVDAFQAAAEEREQMDIPEGAPQEVQWGAKMLNNLSQDPNVDEEEFNQFASLVGQTAQQQMTGRQQENIQEMTSEQALEKAWIENREDMFGGQDEEDPFPDIGPKDSAELTKQGIDELRRTMPPEEFEKLSDEEKRKKGQQLILKQYRNFQNMAGGSQGGGQQGGGPLADILQQASKQKSS